MAGPARQIEGVMWAALIFASLYLVSTQNFLLFHILVESASILIAFAVFIIVLNTKHFLENRYLLFLGLAFPFIGLLDFLHTLAYKGMDIFPGYDSNLPTQLWIQARYLQSVTLLVAPIFLYKKIRVTFVFYLFAAVTAALLLSIFVLDIFPDCFVDPQGLTGFKIISEYIISGILMISLVLLIRRRDFFGKRMFFFVASSIFVTILSELFFTLYDDPYGLSNTLGHLLKALAFFLIYKGLIEAALVEPYSGLFNNLRKSEENLRHAQVELRGKNEALQSFVYAAGHDLRTPLTSATGYVDLVRRKLTGNTSAENMKMLEIARSSLTQLAAMLGDLLRFASLEDSSEEKKTIDLKGILDRITLEKREEIARLGAEINIRDGMPPLYMPETRAYQVFMNLISNSLKFFREGVPPRIEIGTTEVRDFPAPATHQWFFVRDNGIGISPAAREKVFEMFFTSAYGEDSGTGAGLAIVRKIVEKEGGMIRVESEPGKGTTIFLLLLVQREKQNPLKKPDGH
ncbi:MAG: hypothetical protein JXR72_03230 [Proteobacteria bacterium]|nr:hypothetical protein [Pseudomonadota bacterium]